MSSDQTGEEFTWLSPEVALRRFQPDSASLTGTTTQTHKTIRYGYRIGAFNLLIPPLTTSEVLKSAPVYLLPSMPIHVSGVMNFRGNILPVFDLHRLLGVDDSVEAEKRMLLVVGTGKQALSLFIDGFPKTVSLAQEVHSAPLPEFIQGYASAHADQDGALWIDLDHRALFLSLARQSANREWDA